jgi:teichoic acid transport system ATP-binding protein
MTGYSKEVASEYTLQNMSDEERRIFEKTQQKEAEEVVIGEINIDPVFVDKNPVSKVAAIDKIEFLDENRNAKNIFKTGDDLVVRIWFSKSENVDKLNFGVSIYSLEDYFVFGINTLLDNINTKEFVQNGCFDVHYKHINLGTNKYYIRAGIYEDKVEKLVDFVDQSAEYFQVQAFNLNTGIVHLDYEWG